LQIFAKAHPQLSADAAEYVPTLMVAIRARVANVAALQISAKCSAIVGGLTEKPVRTGPTQVNDELSHSVVF
jgi:hypothetical protein